MMYKWFNPIPKDLETLKKQYRKLAMQWHPDRPTGDNDSMKAINTEFDKFYTELEKADSRKHSTGATHTSTASHTKTTPASETAAAFRAIIDKLITLDDIVIEIIGSWLWLSGDTYKHKDTIKALGFKWAKSKRAWYYHSEPYRKVSRKTFTMNELKDLYGSTTVAKGDSLKLTIV